MFDTRVDFGHGSFIRPSHGAKADFVLCIYFSIYLYPTTLLEPYMERQIFVIYTCCIGVSLGGKGGKKTLDRSKGWMAFFEESVYMWLRLRR